MRKFIFTLIFGAFLLPDAGFTLGLGDIEVNSALNQQLDADIALLSATPEDTEQLIVKLASSEEFSRAGIDRPYLLTSLRFKTMQRNGVPYIKVMSPKPIREPFLNFLVEIDWPQGHLLREYTILLDPPVFMGAATPAASSRPAADSGRPAAVSAASQSAPRPAAPVTAAPAAVESSTTVAPAPQPVSQPAPAGFTQPRTSYAPPGGHRIQQGDTAWSLADRLRPDQSVTVEQMMLAMLRNNPEVFINGNVNGLKRGYILRVPEYANIAAIDHNEAVALVRQQNALWREYQQALASGMPASSIATTGGDTSSTAVESGDDARLNIVSAGQGTGMAGSGKDPTQMNLEELRAELAVASEQLESERIEKEELNTRVQSLQDQLDKMKRMLTIEDQGMAEMQASVTESDIPAANDATPALEQTAETPVAGEEVAVDVETDVDVDTGADAIEAAVDQLQDEPVFVDEQQTAQTPDVVAESETETVDTAAPATADDAPEFFTTPQQTGPLDAILNNPIVMGIIAAVVLLFGGLIAFFIKRRKSADKPVAEPSSALPVEDELEDVADMVEDEAVSDLVSDEAVEESMAEAEEEFDAESTMILPTAEDTVVTQAEDLQESPEEDRDDVIAEADVYLAYGIYQQAEELLENAIKEHPDREAYRIKLAETHYAAKNAEGFIAAADGLQEKFGKDGKAWAKVVAMGKDLCPDASLFKAADMVDDVDLDDLMPKAPEMDFDLENDSTESDAAVPDLDFSLDEEDSPLELPETDTTDDTAVLDLEDINLEDAEDSTEAAASLEESAEDILEFDLSDTDALEDTQEDEADEEEFSLDIDASELDLSETSESAEAEQSDEEEIDLTADLTEAADELGDLDDVDEVATKLDLARAYLDMGDSEGTRSILDEVIAEGNDAQKKAAEELLNQL